MNNEGKDATLSREQVERYYAEVTSPDELGVTDPRMKAVFDMALRYRDVLEQEPVATVESLQAEVEMLRAAFESEESEMCKQLNDECNALTNRAESAERKLAEAEAEVERLRNCYATEVRTAQAYLRRTEQSERKLAEAVAALRKYGRHEEDCMFEMALNKHYKCTCGFDEVTK